MHVGDTVPLEDPGALELDVLGTEVVEETAALADEHRDDMQLELVQDAGGEGQNRTGDTTIFSRVLYQLSYLAEAAS